MRPYDRPFEPSDLRGYFTWDAALSARHGGFVHHACHRKHLEEFLAADALLARSECHLSIGGLEHAFSAVWCTLNIYRIDNQFGPFELYWDSSILSGKAFAVFFRDEDRARVTIVENPLGLPMFPGDPFPLKPGDYSQYFDIGKNESLERKDKSIYNVVLTTPLPLGDVRIGATDHPVCKSGDCKGTDSFQNQQELSEIAGRDLERRVVSAADLARWKKRFAGIAQAKFDLH